MGLGTLLSSILIVGRGGEDLMKLKEEVFCFEEEIRA